MDLLTMAILLAAGILIGWWFIPQPKWAKNIYEKIFGGTSPTEPTE